MTEPTHGPDRDLDALPPIERVQAVEIRPGDTLVVTLPEHTTAEAFDLATARIQEMLQRHHRGVNVLVVAAGVDVSVVREVDP